MLCSACHHNIVVHWNFCRMDKPDPVSLFKKVHYFICFQKAARVGSVRLLSFFTGKKLPLLHQNYSP